MNFDRNILFFAFLIHLNVSTGDHGKGEAPLEPAARIATEISSLGRKLLTSLEADSTQHENLLISPTNIFHAVALLHMAAGGNTQQELSTLIGIPPNRNYSKSDIHSAISVFYKTISTDDEKPAILNIADGLFLQEDFQIKKPFQEFAVKQYEAQIENVNFGAGQTTVDKINKWVSEKTRHRITKVVVSFSPDTVAAIVTTLYFNAKWRYRFNKGATEKFYTEENEVDVQMMKLIKHLRYVSNSDLQFQSIDLPYDGSQYALNIILPNPNQSIKNLVPKLKDISISQIMEKSVTIGVEVKLPKTKFNAAKSLVETFQKLGVQNLFSNANLTDLTDEKRRLTISEILHMAEIEINEEGTIATAVTVGHLMLTPGPRPIEDPIPFHVNKPFILNIYNRKTSLNLFSGVVYKP